MSSTYGKSCIISFTACANSKLIYVLQQREKCSEVLFWLQIKSDALASWKKLLNMQTGVGRFINLVNFNISGNTLGFNPSSERLESRLYELENLAEAKRKLLTKKDSQKQRKELLA